MHFYLDISSRTFIALFIGRAWLDRARLRKEHLPLPQLLKNTLLQRPVQKIVIVSDEEEAQETADHINLHLAQDVMDWYVWIRCKVEAGTKKKFEA